VAELTCNECSTRTKLGGVFNITCSACRAALAISEPCKIARKEMVDAMIAKFGPVDDWTVPNCGCERVCKRKEAQRGGYVPK
jgi:hypothetical protein